jgi:NAD(P)-dependent dehydrogenase (short-subunit alcohol dehydrogenase family)
VPADIAKPSEVERLVTEVAKHTDHVDILFANAGASWGASLDKTPESSFNKVMDLNVKSVFLCIQKYDKSYLDYQLLSRTNTQHRFAPMLRKKASLDDPSRVVVTASVAGIGIGSLGENATFAYSASKAAALHLTWLSN